VWDGKAFLLLCNVLEHEEHIMSMELALDESVSYTPIQRMRHSAAHVMAEAVQEIFPDARFAIGPAIEDGFYYDFDLPRAHC
jgi:threonyl-tRNA synthetase